MKKKQEVKEVKQVKSPMVFGYDPKWMKEIGPIHPDFYKVFPKEK